MADEITITGGMNIIKPGVLNQIIPAENVRVTMAGSHFVSAVQDVAHTAHEALAVGSDLGTPGYAMFWNRDDTNLVQIGLEVGGTFYPFLELLAGEQSKPMPLANTTFYAKAAVATVQLQFFIAER